MQQTCLTFVCLSASCTDICVCDEIKSNQCSMLSDHLVWPDVLCSYLDSMLSLWANPLRIRPTETLVSVYRQSRSSVSVFDHCYHVCVCRAALITSSHLQVWQDWRGLSDYNHMGRKIPTEISLISQVEIFCIQKFSVWTQLFLINI